MVALAEAGHRAVAPDMRGYGRTDRPEAIEDYTLFHLAGDVIGLIAALGEKQAIVVGHDWGAVVAWHVALFRPDVCRAVVAMSVPFQPRNPDKQPIPTYREIAREKGFGEFYMVRFQEPGLELNFERDLDYTFRSILYTLSGDVPGDRAWSPFQPAGGDAFANFAVPTACPPGSRRTISPLMSKRFAYPGFAGRSTGIGISTGTGL